MSNPTSEKWTIFGSVGAAVAAAVCCLGPVVLVSLGVTGAWIGNLSAVEPYRPIFMVVAAGLLGFGFYRVYGKSEQHEACDEGEACGEDEACEVPKATRINKVSLWIATVLVAFFFASPYLFELGVDKVSAQQAEAVAEKTDESGAAAEASQTEQVVLEVGGMTCAGCTHTVTKALEGNDGVEKAAVSLEPPRALVTYDPDKVTPDQMMEATKNVGYPSKLAK